VPRVLLEVCVAALVPVQALTLLISQEKFNA
jgi:hypothetical protein